MWGGEILSAGSELRARGYLWTVPMPGGESAVRQPWRMACAWLSLPASATRPLHGRDADLARWRGSRRRVASPLTTSAGRLFDAAAALCGLGIEVTYEGQAAMELETAADSASAARTRSRAWPACSTRATPSAPSTGLAPEPAPTVASRFHHALAAATADDCAVGGRRGLDAVVLSGGAFQNRRLLGRTPHA